jgi:hypothetical protein
MIIEKLQMPYILASQHSIVHYSSLITCLLVEWFYEEADVNYNWNFETPRSKATIIMIITHILCIIMNGLIRFLKMHYFETNFATTSLYLSQILYLFKALLYFSAIVYAQCIVFDNFESKI